MTRLRHLAAVAILPLLIACAPESTASSEPAEVTGFDFYVLALSWSPSYCASEGEDASRFQCGTDRDFGFIVHGLWPQFEDGWPEFCDTGGVERVPNDLADSVSDLVPSRGLVGHQWRKHGSCTGLDQAGYLNAVRRARESIEVPAELIRANAERRMDATAVETGFVDANPGLGTGGIAISCSDGRLDEVRICMNRDFSFRACRQVDERGCKRRGLLLPAAP